LHLLIFFVAYIYVSRDCIIISTQLVLNHSQVLVPLRWRSAISFRSLTAEFFVNLDCPGW
jgi:hypothetical protein